MLNNPRLFIVIIFPFLRVYSAFDSLNGCLTNWGKLPCSSEWLEASTTTKGFYSPPTQQSQNSYAMKPVLPPLLPIWPIIDPTLEIIDTAAISNVISWYSDDIQNLNHFSSQYHFKSTHIRYSDPDCTLLGVKLSKQSFQQRIIKDKSHPFSSLSLGVSTNFN